MKQLLQQSKQIYDEAVEKFTPEAVVAMVSGGSDSATAYHVAKQIGADIDYIFHINTGTGIQENTEFVRNYYGNELPTYVEPSAGDAYEKYVKRKGFFGKGWKAHSYAYHVLKAGPLRKELSRHIRKGKKGVNILLLNGARKKESDNRKINLPDVYNRDPSQAGNIWVNVIHHWSKKECLRYLETMDIERSPVEKTICRSGECNCGTMQTDEDRAEASAVYPDFKEWLDSLEDEVIQTFPWKWGREQPDWYKQLQYGQTEAFGMHKKYDHQFQPMCVGCKNES